MMHLLGISALDAGGLKVPSFELKSLSGKTYTDKDLLGHPTLLIFWASWCHTCQGELPKAHDLLEKAKGRGFRVIAIGFADEETNIRNYVKAHPEVFTFPVLYDPGNRVAARFRANTTPTLFLINANGQIEIPYRGGGLFEHPGFRAKLSELLS